MWCWMHGLVNKMASNSEAQRDSLGMLFPKFCKVMGRGGNFFADKGTRFT